MHDRHAGARRGTNDAHRPPGARQYRDRNVRQRGERQLRRARSFDDEQFGVRLHARRRRAGRSCSSDNRANRRRSGGRDRICGASDQPWSRGRQERDVERGPPRRNNARGRVVAAASDNLHDALVGDRQSGLVPRPRAARRRLSRLRDQGTGLAESRARELDHDCRDGIFAERRISTRLTTGPS